MNDKEQYDWMLRPAESLKGVGAGVAEKLARLSIYTAGDLIRHFPRRYEDYSKILPINRMQSGPVTFRGRVERVGSRYAKARHLHITEAIIADDTGTVKAIWFNQSYLAKTIPRDTPVLISGELKMRHNELALQSPMIERDDETGEAKEAGRIVPVYSETEGLSSRQLRGLVRPLLVLTAACAETLPAEIMADEKLMPYSEALAQIHFPDNGQKLAEARRRLAFEELWYLILASLAIKHEIQAEPGVPVEFSAEVARAAVSAFGFELTPGQKRSAWEIFQDMALERPMNRLLQGDVGSGKTAVAVMAAAMAAASGRQTALMVPTEVLARQHVAKLEKVLTRLGVDVVVLLGGQPVAERRQMLERLNAGGPVLAIGTQALLGESVSFPDLALVIIDEQHRFGVQQRQTLKAKSGRLPHLLTMTATPIPRTLQLTVYGDLDISVINSLPPGRQLTKTRVLEPRRRDEAYELINIQLDAGRQAFIVCPLVDDSDLIKAKSAIAEADRLSSGPFASRRVGLMHGRLSAAEKAAVMNNFAAGELDVLVSTTVIEVGIDVPNATIMMIDGAERFGLAALHQLRGRVGRGAYEAHCILVSESQSPATLERLCALENTHDGFKLAQIDLDIRGPGQIYGRAQHGVLDLRLADISDTELVSAVRQSARAFLDNPDSMIKYPHIANRIRALKAVASLD